MTDKPRKTLTIIRKPTTASPTTGNTDTPVSSGNHHQTHAKTMIT